MIASSRNLLKPSVLLWRVVETISQLTNRASLPSTQKSALKRAQAQLDYSSEPHQPRLYTLAEFSQLPRADTFHLEMTRDWTKSFLAKPHSELGRTGPVCPFLPRSLKLNTVWFATIRAKHLDPDQIAALVKRYRDVFLHLKPTQDEAALYKSIMLVFPDIEDEKGAALIDKVQQQLKPFFVEEGLMIGEFHPWNETPGLHNSDFRPLRSPISMLAIRFMVESDLPFLDRLTDDPQLRSRYLKAYLNRLGTNLEEKKLHQAQQSLVFAQNQIQQTHSSLKQEPSKCPFARLAVICSKLFAKVRAA